MDLYVHSFTGAQLAVAKDAFKTWPGLWRPLMDQRVATKFAMDSLKSCGEIIIITADQSIDADSTNILHNMKGFAFILYMWLPEFRAMCYEIDLMCTQRNADIGNMMINSCLDHFGNNICVLKSLNSAKWFYADTGRFAFSFSKSYVLPKKTGQLNIMWYVPPTHELYACYRFAYLLTKHYYTYEAIKRHGPINVTRYIKWFAKINKKIIANTDLFAEYYSRKGIPNHIAKRIKLHA